MLVFPRKWSTAQQRFYISIELGTLFLLPPRKKIFPCSLPSIPRMNFFPLWTTSLLIKRTIFLTPQPLLCLSFQMSTANEEALRPLNLFKQRWERVYYSMLKLVDEDKHHNRSSVSVIPGDYDPDTPCSLKASSYIILPIRKKTGLEFSIFYFFLSSSPAQNFFPKLMALSPAFKWTQECFKGEE